VPDEETILAKRLADREDRAWEEFCRQYSGPLLGLVRGRFGCSQELAEEIVHLTFIRLPAGAPDEVHQRSAQYGRAREKQIPISNSYQ
jgi:hypothetical protein